MADLLLYPPIRIESPTREDLARRVASIRALALIAVVVASTACGSTREAESSSSTNPAIERAEPEQPPAPVSLDQCVVSVSDAVHESYRTEGQAVPITTVLCGPLTRADGSADRELRERLRASLNKHNLAARTRFVIEENLGAARGTAGRGVVDAVLEGKVVGEAPTTSSGSATWIRLSLSDFDAPVARWKADFAIVLD